MYPIKSVGEMSSGSIGRCLEIDLHRLKLKNPWAVVNLTPTPIKEACSLYKATPEQLGAAIAAAERALLAQEQGMQLPG